MKSNRLLLNICFQLFFQNPNVRIKHVKEAEQIHSFVFIVTFITLIIIHEINLRILLLTGKLYTKLLVYLDKLKI